MSKPIIQLNEETVKSELKELVRNSVEETLKKLLKVNATVAFAVALSLRSFHYYPRLLRAPITL